MQQFATLCISNRPPTEQEVLGIRSLIEEMDPQQQDESHSEPQRLEQSSLSELGQTILESFRGALSAMRSLPAEILGQIFIDCRDDNLDEPWYETTDPYHAPTVLTQVCSRWRLVALHTPQLWNNVPLLTDAFADGREIFVKEILDRSRHVPLSITLASPPDWSTMGDDRERRWLDLVWDSSYRLRHISLDIYSDEAGSQIFPYETIFPHLSSLEISITGDDEPDIQAMLASFGSSPLLRSLTLNLQNVGTDDFIPATFPLPQLTDLDIDAALTTFGVRDILGQCTALETAKIHELFEWDSDDPPPPRDIFTLSHLVQLDISFGLGVGAADLLDAFTLPQLTSLSIASSPRPGQLDQSADAFLALQARSHLSLTHLSLVRQDLAFPQLTSLLRILPELQMLVIANCTTITEPLFQTLARDAADAPALTHPRLELLGVHPVTHLEGEVVARVAEYLEACAGDQGSAFPLLRTLRIYRRDRHLFASTFSNDVEQRLAAVLNIGVKSNFLLISSADSVLPSLVNLVAESASEAVPLTMNGVFRTMTWQWAGASITRYAYQLSLSCFSARPTHTPTDSLSALLAPTARLMNAVDMLSDPPPASVASALLDDSQHHVAGYCWLPSFIMFQIFALVSVLSVAAHTVNAGQLHVVRQNDTAADDCSTPCQALSDSLSAGNAGGLGAICTNTIANNYAACYGCEVKGSGMTQADAQQTIDGYITGCKAGGHPVNSITISADGSTSGGGGDSSPAASGAAPAGSSAPAKTGGAAQTSYGVLGVTVALVFLGFGTVVV
ncbi:hypothetical protein DFH06DRAFT_1132585 [Mycena polygramma]|nr:hypothetical protein DFH06DRAFT_1132585 [Mycena polygramma]